MSQWSNRILVSPHSTPGSFYLLDCTEVFGPDADPPRQLVVHTSDWARMDHGLKEQIVSAMELDPARLEFQRIMGILRDNFTESEGGPDER